MNTPTLKRMSDSMKYDQGTLSFNRPIGWGRSYIDGAIYAGRNGIDTDNYLQAAVQANLAPYDSGAELDGMNP